MFRKRRTAPKRASGASVLFLVHGSSMSGRPTFVSPCPDAANIR